MGSNPTGGTFSAGSHLAGSIAKRHSIGGKKCYDFTTGDRVVAAVYASIGNINDGSYERGVKMTTRKNKVLGTIASMVAVLTLGPVITPTASAPWNADAGTTGRYS